jgi:hypothetical protein
MNSRRRRSAKILALISLRVRDTRVATAAGVTINKWRDGDADESAVRDARSTSVLRYLRMRFSAVARVG